MASRRRWSLPVEVVWWIETIAVCLLIPSPGIVAGVLLAPIFVPVLVSHVRHGRSLGAAGYWFSAAVVSVQAAAVLLIPLGGSLRMTRDWLIWAVAAAIAVVVGVAAWFATPVFVAAQDGSGDDSTAVGPHRASPG